MGVGRGAKYKKKYSRKALEKLNEKKFLHAN